MYHRHFLTKRTVYLKYSAKRRIFNFLLDLWKCGGQKPSFAIDTLRQKLAYHTGFPDYTAVNCFVYLEF